ncbi:GlxA family transcriptional regulator [Amycolatopsis pithecellobii]|uniref:Helix-turn-helix domain-containing protein n=1 Tax=Amycolatopsis pithecellobii TaxID=664692 RepID=A0A6N7ZB49_9PSEU|nr:helix-turn-helix domain-containing protein [Amycolatopsis pithecellobii]MTD58918.1 helix-turn-helix domain-containing protein [Amycolatopsis pithecellobii]
MTHRVAVLALDRVKSFDLGLVAQVLEHAVDASGRPLYSVSTCSLGGRPVHTNHDFTITVQHDESLLTRVDTVIVAAQDERMEFPGPGELPAELTAALASIPARTRVVSLCTGTFVLAAAGMLDGLTATTHWVKCEELARRFPDIDVDPRVLFVDNGRVLTSAGAAAGIDLCLHLVRRDFGAEVASATARVCVFAQWREGGQAQFIEAPVPDAADRSTSPTREWILGRLSEPLTLAQLARHAHMSVRTFTRRFRAEVGQSPSQWIIAQRVNLVRRLLESTDLSVAEIARASGFGTPLVLRKHLRAVAGLTPGAYRNAHALAKPTMAA